MIVSQTQLQNNFGIMPPAFVQNFLPVATTFSRGSECFESLVSLRHRTCRQFVSNARHQKIRALLPSSETLLIAQPNVMLTLTSPALEAAKFVAGPGINLFNFVMIIRIILTWYPKTDLAKIPWIFIAVPTEPLLRATRKVIQPVGGVDISPIVWFAIMSFVHEILVGPQGILVLMSRK